MRILKYILFAIIIGLVAMLATSCGDYYRPYYRVSRAPIIPSNYQKYGEQMRISRDVVVFDGAFDPKAAPNGTSTNTLSTQRIYSAAPARRAASELVGTTWKGTLPDSPSPQLTLTVTQGALQIKMDCEQAAGNVLSAANSVSVPVALDGNTVYLNHILSVLNTSNVDKVNYCWLGLRTVALKFSGSSGSISIQTNAGIPLGTFVKQ